MIKVSMGLLLAFLIGAGCRFFVVPIPGPPKLVGALIAGETVAAGIQQAKDASCPQPSLTK